LNKSARNLVGYCGLYCGACGIYRGRIKQAVENLQGVIRAYGFDKMSSELAKWEPSLQHYKEFEQVMNGLTKLFGECPGCAEGGGDPTCEIRICCKQKGHTICVECTEMDTCKKLTQRDWTMKTLKAIKATGVKDWLADMQKKVKAGYCYLDEKRE
jgi:hypothetical protein